MQKGDATRERIIDRALRLASRDGLDGLSIGTLASELGLSKSGLFGHFGSKDELQLEVLRAAVARFEQTVVVPAFKAPRGEARLKALLNHWISWANDPGMPGGCLLNAATVELDDRPGPLRDYLAATQGQLLEAIARTVRLGIEAGQFRVTLEPEQIAFEMHALVLGYAHQRRLLRDPRAEQRLRTAFERLLVSIRR